MKIYINNLYERKKEVNIYFLNNFKAKNTSIN